MKHCSKCNVDVNTYEDYCPLCFNEITTINEEGTPLLSVTHDKPRTVVKNNLITKIFILITLGIVGVCGFINVMTQGVAWSVLVGASLLYLWIVVSHTILSHRNAFEKILMQLISIIGLLLCTNWISGGGEWFINYVLPSILIIFLVVLDFILLVNVRRAKLLLGFFIIQLFELICCIVFVCISICTFKTLFWIALLMTALSIIGICILGGKPLRQEFVKKFHL